MGNKIEQQFFELYTFLNVAKKYLDTISAFSIVNADTSLKTVDIYIKYPVLLVFGITLILIAILIIIIAPIMVSTVAKNKNKAIQNKAENFWKLVGSNTVINNNKAISQLREEYEKFKNKYMHTIDFLPSQYHDMNTIAYMYNIAASGRADNLKEVINLYEEEMRWLELRNQLEYQQESINRNMENIYNQQVKNNRILNEIEFFQICHYLDQN